ncbi:MAG: hypothetical protein QXP70_00110 [Methanomassiliicoccales archaeon]
MDPVARRQVWQVIQEIKDMGSTIFLTTHYLDETERLSEEFAVIDAGKVLYSGTTEGLKRQAGAEYGAILKDEVQLPLGSYGMVIRDGKRILVLSDRKRVLELADEASRRGIEISVGPVTLEEAFLELSGGMENDE